MQSANVSGTPMFRQSLTEVMIVFKKGGQGIKVANFFTKGTITELSSKVGTCGTTRPPCDPSLTKFPLMEPTEHLHQIESNFVLTHMQVLCFLLRFRSNSVQIPEWRVNLIQILNAKLRQRFLERRVDIYEKHQIIWTSTVSIKTKFTFDGIWIQFSANDVTNRTLFTSTFETFRMVFNRFTRQNQID